MTCRRTAAAVTLLLLVVPVVAAATRLPLAEPVQSPPDRLLDVPYLPQTPDLCGGAAVAMVLRYWGERLVFPEDFASLVDRSAAGIRTAVLTEDVERRGWQARAATLDAGSSAEWMRGHVNNGRPVIALIDAGAARLHYVVVVAWSRDRVIAHDPARAPFRVFTGDEFDRAWTASGRWALLVLPAGSSDTRPTPDPARATPVPRSALPVASPCAALVDEMVGRARAGDLAAAERGLEEATRLCPTSATAWHELAGLRFLQQRWPEAARLAAAAVRLAPDEEAGWDLLGTSRYMNDEPVAALEAWNRIGRPVVDLVRIAGTTRTGHPVIASVVGLPPRTQLTPARLLRASRRLGELPSASLTRLGYRPVAGALAEVDVAIVERRALPRGAVPLAIEAGRALVQRELRIEAASPTGSGERWTAAWRWWEARPRVLLALAMPSPSWLPGVIAIEGVWERQSYAVRSDTASETAVPVRDERRRTAARLSDWATSWLRWEAGLALDRWGDAGHVALEARVETRFAGDRASIGLDAAGWRPTSDTAGFARLGAAAAWRSRVDAARPSWHVSTGLAHATPHARLDVWPGAGTGHARAPLLRAHPLLDKGVVSGDAFGRGLAHASAEYRHPLAGRAAGTLAAAAFADTARAWRRESGRGSDAWHTDVGLGLRLVLPGGAGEARLDVARGLRDGRMALSAGWGLPWPGR